MEYNDEQLLFTNDIEKLAREYNKSLKRDGWTFVKIIEKNEDYDSYKKIISEILTETIALKKFTCSKNVSSYIIDFKEKLSQVFIYEKTDESLSVSRNYCECIKKIITSLCSLLKLCFNDIDKVNMISESISKWTNLIGECRYRKFR